MLATELPADAAYGVLEIVDLVLCKNPTTREAWSATRIQAAQVGLVQSQFLPTLDGRVAASQVRINTRNPNQRSASLTFSWPLFDFSARSANLEVEQQLMSAAASTLDSTVQSVFLDALQAYYNTQAARAAAIAALESEKASLRAGGR